MYVIIPVRYDSTRLPGKPLRDIGGKPLIQYVYERAVQSGAENIVVATDDMRIKDAAVSFGAQVCMTAQDHRSGTERIAEVIQTLNIDENEIIVNLQGDEPLMPVSLIRSVADSLANRPEADVATAMYPISDAGTFNDPNVAKVVCDSQGFALYFSRAPIPWPRTTATAPGDVPAPREAFRHIGLYAYRAGFVVRYASWSACVPEQIEMLEQLRVLWHGPRIFVCQASEVPGPGVDTPEDLERVREMISKVGSA